MTDEVERAYRNLMQLVYVDDAEDQLHAWALSDREPSGDAWELLCDLAGVDADTFANMVRYQRRHLADVGDIAA